MAKQRVVNTRFWDDDYVMELGPTEKLVFLYVLTNPLTDLCGAYQITLKRISFDTGLRPAKLLEVLSKFEEAGKIIYREGWIVIKNFAKHQVSNPKVAKGIERSLNDCPDWIKDSLSIPYHRQSHLNPNLNLKGKPKPEPKPEPQPAPEPKTVPNRVDHKRAEHITTIVTGVTKMQNVKNLPNKVVWMNAAEWAYENGFTSEQFLECCSLMKQQHWRTGAITPRSVTENLPEIEKIRSDVANQGNSRNGTSNQDQRAARAIEKHNVVEAARTRTAERDRARGLRGPDTDGGA